VIADVGHLVRDDQMMLGIEHCFQSSSDPPPFLLSLKIDSLLLAWLPG